VVLAAHALVAVLAVAGAWWLPRGPVSTAQTLVCLGAGVLVGLAVGWATRSRWSVATAPAVYVVVFEIARLGVDGPTVDGIGLSTYGVVALVTGRVFHGLVAVLPLAWGAAAGAALAGRPPREYASSSGAGVARWSRRTVFFATGLALLGLTAAAARPASTAPITGSDGNVVAGSISELVRVPVGEHDLGMMIHGHDRTAPVLLFLAGGPGGSEVGSMRRHLPELEEHFVVVTWDQRGTGRSYGELDPTATLTLESSVSDTLAVTDYLRRRFGQDRIHVVGQSWGSTLGVLAVQAAPEKYAAFVGVGQMVSQRATDRIYYDDTLAWAQETGRGDLADELRRIGPPPYDDPRHYETVLSHEMEMYPYDHSANSEGQGQMSENLFVPEYSLTEQVRVLSGTIDTFAVLYPQLQDIDFRRTATDFEVPVFFVQGAHEAPGRAELFDDWYPRVRAPVKDLVVLDTSGHRPLFEQPDEFVDYLTDVVLPRTSG
jgi:pimeloyl-ACP methyl ester carboxylesterase